MIDYKIQGTAVALLAAVLIAPALSRAETRAAAPSQAPMVDAAKADSLRKSRPGDAAKDTAGPATAAPADVPAAPATVIAAPVLKPDTLVGEVIDIQCLARQERLRALGATQDASGKTWSQCGSEAVRSGAPVGIRLRDGSRIYVVAMQNRKPAGRTLAQYVGREVTVTGWRLTEGGVPLVEISKVIPSEDARSSRAPEAD